MSAATAAGSGLARFRNAVYARWADRGAQSGFVVMAGLAVWMLVGGVVMTALLGMTLSVAQQSKLQAQASRNARSVDGALEVAVATLQTDPTARAGVPTGRGDGSCAAGLGSGGGDLVVAGDESTGVPVTVYISCSGAPSAKEIHRVVLIATTSDRSVTGSAALSVVAGERGGNDVAIDSWVVADPTAVTTTTSTTVAPATTTTRVPDSTTTTRVPPSTTTTTTVGEGVTWALTYQSDWWFGYCADVAVSNPTGRPIDWKVAVKIEGRAYTVWNADWYQDGSTLVAAGVDWNRTVPPKGTRSFGFCANR